MRKFLSLSLSLSLLSLVIISGGILASGTVSADNDSVVDQVNITVSSSCTLGGTGMNSHNASINNGQYNSAIGETTMQAFCNDAEGFAIYAIGYTDNTDGNNVLTNSTLGSTYDIVTGTATSGANSNWAMKLSTVTSPTPTYPITIQNSFDNFHNVPDDYALVAKRESGTDIGAGAEGATFKSTYQAYINATQPAGTYTGQVKYVMVHPHSAATPRRIVSGTLEVTYSGRHPSNPNWNYYFDPAKTQTENVVTYSTSCEVETTQYDVIKTSNLSDDGTKNSPYIEEHINTIKTYPEASKVKVVVEYGITAGTAGIGIRGENNQEYNIYSEQNNLSGTETYILNGNGFELFVGAWPSDNLATNYDYGAYIRIYPLDANNNEIPINTYSNCSYEAIDGTYLDTIYNNTGDSTYLWEYSENVAPFTEQSILNTIFDSGIHDGQVNVRAMTGSVV